MAAGDGDKPLRSSREDSGGGRRGHRSRHRHSSVDAPPRRRFERSRSSSAEEEIEKRRSSPRGHERHDRTGDRGEMREREARSKEFRGFSDGNDSVKRERDLSRLDGSDGAGDDVGSREKRRLKADKEHRKAEVEITSSSDDGSEEEEEEESSEGGRRSKKRKGAGNGEVRDEKERKRRHRSADSGSEEDEGSSDSESASAGTAGSSDESQDERERARKRKKRKRREERERGKEKHQRRKEKKRKLKEKEREQEKRRKKKEKVEKRAKGPITSSWGKYGLIKEIDMWTKRPEFSAWLSEVRKVNLETLTTREEKEMFKQYMEDYNTATFPSKKYYNIDIYHRRKMTKMRVKGMMAMAKAKTERTEFNDEEQRRQELMRERAKQKEAEVEALKRSMQSGMGQAMREQAQLREEMQYHYRLGNTKAAAAIQRRLDPDALGGDS